MSLTTTEALNTLSSPTIQKETHFVTGETS